MKTRYRVLILLLAIPLCVLLFCIGLLQFGRHYGQWRMDTGRAEMFQVAELLGYEPSAHLLDAVSGSDANIVTGSHLCYSMLLYTTPLSLDEFEQRLEQLPWKSVAATAPYDDWYSLHRPLGLTADGLRYEDDRFAYDMKFHGHGQRTWGLEGKSVRIYFYDISALDVRLEYKDQPFTQNVVYVRVGRGRYPIWMYCPVQTNTEPGAAAMRHSHLVSAESTATSQSSTGLLEGIPSGQFVELFRIIRLLEQGRS